MARYTEVLQATCFSVGRPLTQPTIVIGNVMLLFSSLLVFFRLGMVVGVAFSMALLADLFFAPASIMLLKPLGKETATASLCLTTESQHAQ
ncbi:MAG: hypothetical protein CSA21_00570 [Deltaproteobacteria bacterium]|nr:MAG: hypothetical protein CSA21_00570 [Deltaproteobacteria bacterium]